MVISPTLRMSLPCPTTLPGAGTGSSAGAARGPPASSGRGPGPAQPWPQGAGAQQSLRVAGGPRLGGTRGVHLGGAVEASAESAPFGVTSSTGRGRWGRDGGATALGEPEVGERQGWRDVRWVGQSFGDAGTCDRAREAGVRALCPGRRG